MALVRCQVIASGGVSTIEDVLRLAAMPGLLRHHHRQSALRYRIRLDELAASVHPRETL